MKSNFRKTFHKETKGGNLLFKFSNKRILRMSSADLAKIGLYKLIMSDQTDLARLTENDGLITDSSELFCLNEIKRSDKGCDVKSFDKIKAVELLIELSKIEQAKSDDGESFLQSFKDSCEKLNLSSASKEADENE